MKNQLKNIMIFVMLVLPCTAFSQINPTLPINKVSFQLTMEQWTSTKTAKVIVGLNAALSDAQLGKIHDTIMKNLSTIVPGTDWHITQFQRQKDQSGLEHLLVTAETRIPEAGLADLRKQATLVSKPGQTYRIIDIQFTPSPGELEQVRSQLRAKIYAKAKDELATLNKIYPNSKFYLNSINFRTMLPVPIAQPMMLMANGAVSKRTDKALAVSNKVQLIANVVLASNPNEPTTAK